MPRAQSTVTPPPPQSHSGVPVGTQEYTSFLPCGIGLCVIPVLDVMDSGLRQRTWEEKRS